MTLKVKTLKVQRLRNVLEASFEFEWSMVKISGDNGAGKSTIIDAIFLAIIGKTYAGKGRSIEKLITMWQETSEIEVELAWSDRTIKIKRKITESWNVWLDIRASDGSKLYQKDLDALLSEFTVDPLEFTRKSNREKYETIKNVTWVDTERVDAEIEVQEEKTKQARAVATEYKKTLDNIGNPEKVERVDTAELTEQINKIVSDNAKIDNLDEKIKNWEEYIAELQQKLAEAVKLKDQYKAEREQLGEKKPLEELREKANKAAEINRQAEQWEKYKEMRQKSLDADTMLAGNKEKLEELRGKKKDMIATAQMPIDDMEFSEKDGVIIKDIPFDQYSSAQQLKMACKIATATNPLLKVIYIKDGSLLDEKSMQEMEEFAEKEWYQIFIERVGEEFDSIVMREGRQVGDLTNKEATAES